MHRRVILSLIVLFSPSACAAAPEPWLPTAARTRQEVLTDLLPKAKMPPYDKVLRLLTQAQAELAEADPDKKLGSVDDAYDAALLIQTKTTDHALAARLFDGFILPSLRFARADPTFYDSRRQILKAAFGAYQQAGQDDRQIAVLVLLRREAAEDENFLDWTNLQLASLYAHRGQYKPAIEALEAVQTPGMMGSKAYLPALRQKLEEQQVQEKQKETQKEKRTVRSVPLMKSSKKSSKRKVKH